MSELIEFIPLVQSSEVENDVDNEQKNDLVSDLQEANDILAYFKKEYGNTEPERYQKLLKEHEDLRVTTIDAVKSENKITVSELESIKKEFEDIKEIESY
jgi:tellurite resistance protein